MAVGFLATVFASIYRIHIKRIHTSAERVKVTWVGLATGCAEMKFPIAQIIGGGLMLQKVSTKGENVEHYCDDEQRIVGGYLGSDGQLPSILVQLDGECKNMERQNCDKGVVYRNSVLDNRSHGVQYLYNTK
ncbi:Uncharacterized protein Fot_28751 [Forsythia ovata]|uniref:Uncharacterized protein n=1 Tax=Forsythia ovata TaxID=205694 RepID=A0ABD1TPW8_9LAMI